MTIRGTGSSGNSTTLKDLKTGKSLVLDAGIKPSKKFAKENILAVLITHRHTDHYSYASAYHDTPIIGSPLELYIKTDNVKFIENGETVVYGPFEITALSADMIQMIRFTISLSVVIWLSSMDVMQFHYLAIIISISSRQIL